MDVSDEWESKLQAKTAEQQSIDESELVEYEAAHSTEESEAPMEEWEKKLHTKEMEAHILEEPLEEEWEKKLRTKENERRLEEQLGIVPESDLARFEEPAQVPVAASRLLEEWEKRLQQGAQPAP